MSETKKTRRPLTVAEIAMELAALCAEHAYQPPKSTLLLVAAFAAKHGEINAAKMLTAVRWRQQNGHPIQPEVELLAKCNVEARETFAVYTPAMKEVEA